MSFHVQPRYPSGEAVSLDTDSSPVPRTLTRVTLRRHTATYLEALIGSGADESLMKWGLAKKLALKSEPLAKPIRARSLNGKELVAITHISEPIQMHIDNHHVVHLFIL